MSYPKWLYYKSESAVIVQDEAEESKLGIGWADTPAAFEQSPVEQKSEEVIEAKPKRRTKKDAE